MAQGAQAQTLSSWVDIQLQSQQKREWNPHPRPDNDDTLQARFPTSRAKPLGYSHLPDAPPTPAAHPKEGEEAELQREGRAREGLGGSPLHTGPPGRHSPSCTTGSSGSFFACAHWGPRGDQPEPRHAARCSRSQAASPGARRELRPKTWPEGGPDPAPGGSLGQGHSRGPRGPQSPPSDTPPPGTDLGQRPPASVASAP